MEQKPIYDLLYRITEDEYEKFNFILVRDQIKKYQRRSKVLGTLEVAVGALMLISMLTSMANSEPLYYVLDIILIALGIYSLSFYTFLFPKKLKKASAKSYASNQYLNNDIHMLIFDDCVHEHSFEVDNIVEWDGFARLHLTKELLLMVLKDNKCIIVPLREIDDVSKLDSFLTGVHDTWGVKYIKD